ncbi:MAG TPA: porin [Methyloceanibacter sp.]|nr:porin [Methyloceanibacter sp.]
MDMFGGLTKTSSRIAIAAAFGLMLGGFAFKATPAQAADLGGDCCADLEERVAELEATTVRKGNKKVSVTLSGWVVKTLNFWDDEKIGSFFVGDKGYDLGTRFAITGSATIAPGWSAGYNITVNTWGDKFTTAGASLGLPATGASNQFDEGGDSFGSINTLYSYIYIKSDTWGTVNWGHLSPASDNPAVLADISGTVIETNAVWFEGASFFLRPKGTGVKGGYNSLSGAAWQDFIRCQGLGVGLGTDCFGAAQPAIRYDSPTWGGFRFETSYGTQEAINPMINVPLGLPASINTPDSHFWDIAGFYTGDWNSIKLSVAAAYTWMETGALSSLFAVPNANCRTFFGDEDFDVGCGNNADLFQIGASIMHKPSGLGIYGMYQLEDGGYRVFDVVANDGSLRSSPETDAWYLKPFWRKAWSPIGATVLYGEYGQYNDQFIATSANVAGQFAFPVTWGFDLAQITGSEVERYGLGVVQEIDSAAMHLWLRWQHQEIDVNLLARDFGNSAVRVNQSYDDWDLFQAGGVIFF